MRSSANNSHSSFNLHASLRVPRKKKLEKEKRKRRIKTALIVLGFIALSVGIAAAIVFGGGIPLVPFLPLLVAAVVNPVAVTAILAGFTAVGLTLLYGVGKLGMTFSKWLRGKMNQPKKVTPPATAPLTPPSQAAQEETLRRQQEETLRNYDQEQLINHNQIVWRLRTDGKFFTTCREEELPDDYDKTPLISGHLEISNLTILIRKTLPDNWKAVLLNNRMWVEQLVLNPVPTLPVSTNHSSLFNGSSSSTSSATQPAQSQPQSPPSSPRK